MPLICSAASQVPRWQHAWPDLYNQLQAPNWGTAQVCAWWPAYSITLNTNACMHTHQRLHAYAL